MPCDYKNYPHNWKTVIRPAILQRAGARPHLGIEAKCEACDVTNHSQRRSKDSKRPWNITVVLTIAHLDHNTQNNKPENLAALCQKCHNCWDRARRLINSSATRDRNRKQSLFSFATAENWRANMPPTKESHSFNVILTDEQMTQLSHMAEKRQTNKSIVIRQAIAYRFTMEIQNVPTCASGMACMVPHMHAQTHQPQQGETPWHPTKPHHPHQPSGTTPTIPAPDAAAPSPQAQPQSSLASPNSSAENADGD